MSPGPRLARDIARRLWARSAGAGTPSDVGSAAERLCIDLRSRLSAWIGPEGYRVLLDRAIARTRVGHPVLDSLSCLTHESGAASTAIATQGHETVAAGLTALLVELIESLERIVGADLAGGLVEQAVMPAPLRPERHPAQRGTHG